MAICHFRPVTPTDNSEYEKNICLAKRRMEGENTIDFDSAIDNFFDFFTEGDDADRPTILKSERKRGQRNHQPKRRSGKVHVKEDLVERNDTLIVPKVVKNDIRRYYSRMFMNTINCGDFNQLQSYFSTFMRGPAKFLANYGNFNPNLRLPVQLIADGPKLMSHFLLGVFVMYPDMVMHLHETRIISSNSWSGTRIEMNVEFLATKMYDLSIGDWIPELASLEERCNSLTEEKQDNLRNGFASVPCDSSSSPPSNTNQENDCLVSSSSSVSSLSSEDSVGENSEQVVNDNSFQAFAMPSIHTTPAHRAKDRVHEVNDETDFPASKRIRGRRAPQKDDPLKTPGENLEHRLSSPPSPSNTLIPEAYVRSLCLKAALLSTPLELRMIGKVTLFLDENNHIQHMNMDVFPKEG